MELLGRLDLRSAEILMYDSVNIRSSGKVVNAASTKLGNLFLPAKFYKCKRHQFVFTTQFGFGCK